MSLWKAEGRAGLGGREAPPAAAQLHAPCLPGLTSAAPPARALPAGASPTAPSPEQQVRHRMMKGDNQGTVTSLLK